MSDTKEFDVFLSHNSQEKSYVEEIANWLEQQHIRVWYDKWQLRPGFPWQKELEEGILHSISVVVCFGKSGLGSWHEPEMRAALQEAIRRNCAVIPVLLPDIPSNFEIPLFLRDYTWVDFRNGVDNDEAKAKLLWGITGKNPHTTSVKIMKTIRDTSLPATLMQEGRLRRLRRKLDSLERQEELLNEKIDYLKEGYLLEASHVHKFQMKKQIEQIEKELEEIEQIIENIYQELENQKETENV